MFRLRPLVSALILFALAAPALAQSRLPAEGFADLAERLSPAVVNISTSQRVQGLEDLPRFPPGSPMERFNEGQGEGGAQITSLGSGFIISADGVVVTNNHVIEAADAIEVILQNGQRFEATVVGRDPATDIAVLRMHARTPLPYVNMGDSDTARVGDIVLAIGNPFGLGGSLSVGVVSARNRNIDAGRYDDFIQTDAAINRGNSGGPLFDLQGNVVGINNMLISPVGANIGVNFAIPADAAIPVINALRAGEKVQRGYLGIGIAPVDEDLAAALGLPKDRGEFIQRVEPGQAGEKAGLKRGDVVTKVNSREVTPQQTLSYIVSNTKPGTRIPLEIIRDGKPMTLNVLVGTRPPEEELVGSSFDPEEEQTVPEDPTGAADKAIQEELGLAVQVVTPDIARAVGVDAGTKGLVIAAASANSDAGRKGLRRGDVILSANRTPVATSDALAKAVADAKRAGRDAVLLEILRRGNPSAFIAVRLK